MKKIMALMLATSLVLTPTVSVNATDTASVKSSITDTVSSYVPLALDMKLGTLKKLDLTKKGIDKKDNLSSYGVVNFNEATANLDIDYVNGKLYIHAETEGVINHSIEFASGKQITIVGTVSGLPQKNSKYNKLYSVVGLAKKKTFAYTGTSLSVDYNSKGKINKIYVKSLNVTNLSLKNDVTPDIKITFYNKNKKKIKTIQATKQEGSHINVRLEVGESYQFFETATGLTEKQSKSVKYWRIEDL